jgi:cation transport regulator
VKVFKGGNYPMPYTSTQELPERVKNNLPPHAQEIYKEAFNHAWQQYADPEKRRGPESQEEVAHKVAWSAVETKYTKSGDRWVPRKSDT